MERYTYFPHILQGYSSTRSMDDGVGVTEFARRSMCEVGVGDRRTVPPWIRMWPLRAARELKLCNNRYYV